jgi:DNA replication protein DnaC
VRRIICVGCTIPCDVPAATAILDRLLAHATIVQVTGKRYRLRQRASTTDD